MCNLYRMTKSAAEVARWFNLPDETQGANAGGEVYPGYSGVVVAQDAVQMMVWGFPLVLKSKRTGEPLKPRPVNNARSDKLDQFMWRYSFAERRCVIPLSAWAEAEGARGSMTRTWLSVPDAELFACAGIWRDSEEWGRCYSMIMTDAVGLAAEVHDRMPVLLAKTDFSRWANGTMDDARGLIESWDGSITIERTDQKWSA